MAPGRRTVTWVVRAQRVVLGCILATGCGASGLRLEPGMRIELTTDGGFAAIPGLATPILVDAANLSPEHSVELKRLTGDALAEKASRGPAKAAPIPDGRRYRITIQHDAAHYELDAADPMIPPAFAALMEFVRANGRR